MIQFRCQGCGTGVRVSDDKAGKKGRCPKCSAIVRVPVGVAVSLTPGRVVPQDTAERPASDAGPADHMPGRIQQSRQTAQSSPQQEMTRGTSWLADYGPGTKVVFAIMGLAFLGLLGFGLWAFVLRDTSEQDGIAVAMRQGGGNDKPDDGGNGGGKGGGGDKPDDGGNGAGKGGRGDKPDDGGNGGGKGGGDRKKGGIAVDLPPGPDLAASKIDVAITANPDRVPVSVKLTDVGEGVFSERTGVVMLVLTWKVKKGQDLVRNGVRPSLRALAAVPREFRDKVSHNEYPVWMRSTSLPATEERDASTSRLLGLQASVDGDAVFMWPIRTDTRHCELHLPDLRPLKLSFTVSPHKQPGILTDLPPCPSVPAKNIKVTITGNPDRVPVEVGLHDATVGVFPRIISEQKGVVVLVVIWDVKAGQNLMPGGNRPRLRALAAVPREFGKMVRQGSYPMWLESRTGTTEATRGDDGLPSKLVAKADGKAVFFWPLRTDTQSSELVLPPFRPIRLAFAGGAKPDEQHAATEPTPKPVPSAELPKAALLRDADQQIKTLIGKLLQHQGAGASGPQKLTRLLTALEGARKKGATLAQFDFSWESADGKWALDLQKGLWTANGKTTPYQGNGLIVCKAGKSSEDAALAKEIADQLKGPPFARSMKEASLRAALGPPDKIVRGRPLSLSTGATITEYDRHEYLDGIVVFFVDDKVLMRVCFDLARLSSQGSSDRTLVPGQYKLNWFVSGVVLGTGRDDDVTLRQGADGPVITIRNRTSPLRMGKGYVEFSGAYADGSRILFRGRIQQNGDASGTLSGSVHDAMGGGIRSFYHGTFSLTKVTNQAAGKTGPAPKRPDAAASVTAKEARSRIGQNLTVQLKIESSGRYSRGHVVLSETYRPPQGAVSGVFPDVTGRVVLRQIPFLIVLEPHVIKALASRGIRNVETHFIGKVVRVSGTVQTLTTPKDTRRFAGIKVTDAGQIETVP